jgi:hypothetical protein
MAMTDKTYLEFSYTPPDFFEESASYQMEWGTLMVEHGKAIYTLSSPVSNVSDELRAEVAEETSRVFNLRQVLVGRPYRLTGPDVVVHYGDGDTGRVIHVGLCEELNLSASVETMTIDESGRVTHDSRQERIDAHDGFMNSMIPKMGEATLRHMVSSLGRALSDPENEFVHLYELRDAASKKYGGEGPARAALGISKGDWSLLGRLANDAPLRQGRHRGVHAHQLRDATLEELSEARRVARTILDAYAKTLP